MTSNNRRERKRDPSPGMVTSEDIDPFDTVYGDFGFSPYPSSPPDTLNPPMAGVLGESYGVDIGTDPSGFPGGYMPVDCFPSGYDASYTIEGIENDGYVAIPGNYPSFSGVESISTPIDTFAREGGPSPEEVQQRGHDESFSDTGTFQCKWNGCTDPRTFQQTRDMVEHIKTVHIQENTFQCEWNGCKKPGTLFKRKRDLVRHVVTIDIKPNSFKCLEEGCYHSCSRKDNLTTHMRRKH